MCKEKVRNRKLFRPQSNHNFEIHPQTKLPIFYSILSNNPIPSTPAQNAFYFSWHLSHNWGIILDKVSLKIFHNLNSGLCFHPGGVRAYLENFLPRFSKFVKVLTAKFQLELKRTSISKNFNVRHSDQECLGDSKMYC